jgi:hypothetical protein
LAVLVGAGPQPHALVRFLPQQDKLLIELRAICVGQIKVYAIDEVSRFKAYEVTAHLLIASTPRPGTTHDNRSGDSELDCYAIIV